MDNGSEYWIVRIPIEKEKDDILSFGKYEKMEAKVLQMNKEKKAENTIRLEDGKLNLSKKMLEVGSRYIGVYVEEKDEEYELYPIGSLMDKMVKKGV